MSHTHNKESPYLTPKVGSQLRLPSSLHQARWQAVLISPHQDHFSNELGKIFFSKLTTEVCKPASQFVCFRPPQAFQKMLLKVSPLKRHGADPKSTLKNVDLRSPSS
jgi:hypothetical protein